MNESEIQQQEHTFCPLYLAAIGHPVLGDRTYARKTSLRAETLFYCDPPYWMMLEKGARPYYQCGFEEADHVRLRDTLAGIKGKVILTYDDHPEVRRLYKGFTIRGAGQVNYPMNNRPGSKPRHRPELLMTNY